MSDDARGGADTLVGGANASNRQIGDADRIEGRAIAGNDRLAGGANATNFIYGDGIELADSAHGGNNVLVAGAGSTDFIWGCAASVDATASVSHNTFVFGPGIGHDTIEDFHHGMDVIDLAGFASFGLHAFSSLSMRSSTTGTVLAFANGSDVTVAGLASLQASDFHFG